MQSDSPTYGGGGKCLKLKILSLFCIFFTALNAIELETLCQNDTCSITTPNALITNHKSLTLNSITFSANVNDFINYGNLILTDRKQGQINATMNNLINYGTINLNKSYNLDPTLTIGANGAISNIFNYGNFLGGNKLQFDNQNSTTYIYNAGVIGSIHSQSTNTIIINNLGAIEADNGALQFGALGNLVLENYALAINLSASIFNTGEWVQDKNKINSHLILQNVANVRFKDSNSKIIIDIGENFELGKEYSINKLIIDESRNDNAGGKIAVDFSRLTTRSDLYEITKSSNNTFKIGINAKNSTMNALNKANTKTMQSLMLTSNAMIFGSGAGKIGADKIKMAKVDFAKQYLANKAIKNNDRFFYKNDSLLLAESSYRLDAIRSDEIESKSNESLNTKADSSQKGKYRFMLTPFVNHNIFFESGVHNLSSLDVGFVTLFSGKIDENNELGTHFSFSYGNLKDDNDKAFNIKSMNLNVGLNYKVDFIYDTYLKARIDAFYFMNKLKSLTILNTLKPNNVGFGMSAYGGKDFYLGALGIFGLEVGLDYKMLHQKSMTISNASNTIYETYDKAFYQLLYLDLGLAYSKYFSTSIGLWGLNAKVGYRDNLTNNALAKSKVFLSRGGSVNMTIDNDNALGYYSIGGSYVLETTNFDMEFELNYIGGVGDRSVSNGGGFKWIVLW